MTRTLYRKSSLRRVLSAWITLAFLFSITGVGWAVPPEPVSDPAPIEAAPAQPPAPVEQAPDEAPEPPAAAPEPDDAVKAEPVVPDAVPAQDPADERSVEAAPVTAAPDDPAVATAAQEAKTEAVVPASSVPPVTEGGNPPYPDLGTRIDEQDLPGPGGTQTYTRTDGGITVHITISVYDNGNGPEFDWSSDWPIEVVVAKGGSQGANIYTYEPPALGDTGLHCPANPNGKWAGISHIDFHFAAGADITVVKFEDLDHDGAHDEGEPLLPGWSITVRDEAGSAVGSAETGDDGEAFFGGLAPAHYTVEESLKPGWMTTSDPYPVPVELESGESVTVHLGNAQVADVEVIKFEDTNKNGEVDEGEPILPGWTFDLMEGDALFGSEITNDQGSALFEDVFAGTYTLDEHAQPGWFCTTGLPKTIEVVGGENQTVFVGNAHEDVVKTFELTYPDKPEEVMLHVELWVDGQYSETIDLEPVEGDLYAAQVTVPYGSVIEGSWVAMTPTALETLATFGPEEMLEDVTNELEYAPTVDGLKYEDLDGDGTRDEGEPGLGGWTIKLFRLSAQTPGFADVEPADSVWVEVGSALTDDDGTYSFPGLIPGTYKVEEDLKPGWTQTQGQPDAFAVDIDASVSGLDFGNVESPTLTVLKFEDVNGDGVRQAGEALLPGWAFTLTGPGDALTARTEMTGVDGSALFDGLEPGTYSLDEVVQAGWSATTALPKSITLISGQDAIVEVGNQASILPFTDTGIVKTVDKSSAAAGDTLTYTLTYQLTAGDRLDPPITITDDYDERYLTPVDLNGGVASDGKIVWTDTAALLKGDVRTITYTMKIDETMPDGTTNIDNVAVISPFGASDAARVTVGSPFLPFTGTDLMLLALAAIIAAAAGMLLRLLGRPTLS